MRYLRTLLKHWYLCILPLVIIPVAVTYYGSRQPPLYQSSALLNVDKPAFLSAQDFAADPTTPPAQYETTAMTELLQSTTFAATVAAQTPLAHVFNLHTQAGRDAAAARISSEVRIAPSAVGTHLIWVSATDTSPHIAQAIVSALLNQYAARYQADRLQLDQQAVTYYQQQLAIAQSQLAQDIQRLRLYQRQHPGSARSQPTTDPQLARLQNQLNQDQARANTLTNQLVTVQQDAQAVPIAASDLFRVIDPPQLPLQPTISESKLLLTYFGGGLAAALVLVSLVVVGLTRLDRKIYATEDLRAIAKDLGLDLVAIESLPRLVEAGRGGIEGGTWLGETAEALLPAFAAQGRHMSEPTQQTPQQWARMPNSIPQDVRDAGEQA
jgi:uncharacterized protein involved in exopolysaccharide biosynthesis